MDYCSPRAPLGQGICVLANGPRVPSPRQQKALRKRMACIGLDTLRARREVACLPACTEPLRSRGRATLPSEFTTPGRASEQSNWLVKEELVKEELVKGGQHQRDGGLGNVGPVDRRLRATTRSRREVNAIRKPEKSGNAAHVQPSAQHQAYTGPTGMWNSHPAKSLFDMDAGVTEDLYSSRTAVGGARIHPPRILR
ncbi:hypothetical protein ABIE00_004766 [Arthrobacter sp. OAP107]